MNNEHLMSCKQAIAELVENTSSVCAKYAERDPAISEAVAKFRKVYEDRIDDLNPRIMIYGIYNAGKSTLLNALIGENQAAMNDVPTTVKVTPYRWKEYTIFDTPGINAPKKDEEVSKEQLNKSDVIIFVMDTEGAFNLGKNYRELVDVVKGKKKLLIVLNNKSSIEMDTQEGVAELEKIKGNIYRDFAECYGSTSAEELSRHFKIVVVDAKLALEARTNAALPEADKTVMLHTSNILALESEIVNVYASATGFTVLDEIAHLLSHELDLVQGLLKKLEGDKVAQGGYEAIEQLQKQQEKLLNKVKDRIEALTASLKGEIRSILTSATDEDDAKAKLSERVKVVASDVEKYLVNEAKKISQRVEDCVGGFEQIASACVPAISHSKESGDDTQMALMASEGGQLNPAGKKEKLLETTAAAAVAKPMLDAGVKAALPLVAKIPVLGPVLVPVLPVLAPVLLAIAAFKFLFGGSDDEKALEAKREQYEAQLAARNAQQEEMARRKQEIVENSLNVAQQIEMKLGDFFTDQVERIFEPQYVRVQEAINMGNAEAAQIAGDLRLIEGAQKELVAVASKLKV